MPIRHASRFVWFPLVTLLAAALAVGGMAAFGPAASPAPEAAAPVAPVASSEFPDAWYYRAAKRPRQYRELEGKRAPELTVTDWIGERQELKELEGKVVVVDFWGVWCRPCMAAVPKNIKMAKKYREKGLVFIGVHSTQMANKMAPAVKSKRINYPVAVDVANRSKSAWKVSFWPTYAVVDHKGVVRAIGLLPTHVERVVKKLLDEMHADTKKSKTGGGEG